MAHEVEIQVITENGVQLPFYATEGSAGMDVRAHLSENLCIKPGEVKLVPTGLRVAIPEGYEIQIRPRSGMAFKSQVIPLNTPGTIDSDFRGEVQVILTNLGNKDFIVEPGMRVAQMVVAPYCQVKWSSATELNSTLRGENGFGGTGIQ